MDAATISSWMREVEASVRAERDHLVQLDSAIGDGDHGINMTRGFEAVVQALGADNGSPPGRLLIIAGRTLVSTVGGASGPLWGTALRRAGRSMGDGATFEAAVFADALEAALDGVVELGAAQPGDKPFLGNALRPQSEDQRAKLHKRRLGLIDDVVERLDQPLTLWNPSGRPSRSLSRDRYPIKCLQGRVVQFPRQALSFVGARALAELVIQCLPRLRHRALLNQHPNLWRSRRMAELRA